MKPPAPARYGARVLLLQGAVIISLPFVTFSRPHHNVFCPPKGRVYAVFETSFLDNEKTDFSSRKDADCNRLGRVSVRVP